MRHDLELGAPVVLSKEVWLAMKSCAPVTSSEQAIRSRGLVVCAPDYEPRGTGGSHLHTNITSSHRGYEVFPDSTVSPERRTVCIQATGLDAMFLPTRQLVVTFIVVTVAALSSHQGDAAPNVISDALSSTANMTAGFISKIPFLKYLVSPSSGNTVVEGGMPWIKELFKYSPLAKMMARIFPDVELVSGKEVSVTDWSKFLAIDTEVLGSIPGVLVNIVVRVPCYRYRSPGFNPWQRCNRSKATLFLYAPDIFGISHTVERKWMLFVLVTALRSGHTIAGRLYMTVENIHSVAVSDRRAIYKVVNHDREDSGYIEFCKSTCHTKERLEYYSTRESEILPVLSGMFCVQFPQRGRYGRVDKASTTLHSSTPPTTVLHNTAATTITPRLIGVPSARVIYLPDIRVLTVSHTGVPTTKVVCPPDIRVLTARATHVPTTRVVCLQTSESAESPACPPPVEEEGFFFRCISIAIMPFKCGICEGSYAKLSDPIRHKHQCHQTPPNPAHQDASWDKGVLCSALDLTEKEEYNRLVVGALEVVEARALSPFTDGGAAPTERMEATFPPFI
uniref:C2H2-type domain-containing protein n=1 Tax=Timema poppense TaxID=170557 RepID=A0A7R9D9Z5_TIMPO|nr:unnamed protein product [Timema poppensis]